MIVSETSTSLASYRLPMTVTLRDIARHTNVSVSTVSRALNQHQYVDEETRALVQQAATDLGYRMNNLRRKPNNTGRGVVSLLSNMGALAGVDAGPLQSHRIEHSIAIGAGRLLSQVGFDTRLQQTNLVREDLDSYIADPDIAGIILMGGVQNNELVHRLLITGLPLVIAGSHAKPLFVNAVMADYGYGVKEAIAHLVERGHKRIGLVNGPPTTNTSHEKYLGYRLGLALNDLPYTPNHVVPADFTPEAGLSATQKLLARSPDIDAIVYSDDYAALGGLRALKLSGYRVPQDVAVVGFHDYEVARYTDPPLTTVRFDMTQMGAIAARRLVTMISENTENAWMTLIPTSLVVRETT
jgi:DNA-binding LacI/PurR family transcriptional regulator